MSVSCQSSIFLTLFRVRTSSPPSSSSSMWVCFCPSSGVLHVVLDHPANIALPFFGQACLEFQWHHHIPDGELIHFIFAHAYRIIYGGFSFSISVACAPLFHWVFSLTFSSLLWLFSLFVSLARRHLQEGLHGRVRGPECGGGPPHGDSLGLVQQRRH